MDEREIFADAIERTDPEERSAWLDRVCGNDLALLDRMRVLLGNHHADASFLERPPAAVCEAPTLFGDGDTHEDHSPVITQGDSDFVRVVDGIDLDFLEASDQPDSLGRLGAYEVTGVIDRGGMGIVLKAMDPSLNRVVALKVLAPEHTKNPTAHVRFLREAKAVAAVPHPNIVTVYSVHDGPSPFIVMELVEGKPLSDAISPSDPMDTATVVEIGMQVANGLAIAHERGLIHRDIKPGNILVETDTGRVKITDFGLARVADDVAVTRTGEVAGTPRYMSPEQAQGLPVDHRADIFSFGGTLYAMSTGHPPFDADSVVSVLRLVCDQPHVPVRDHNPHISKWLAELIDRMMAKEPATRFRTAEDVSRLLKDYALHLHQPKTTPPPAFERVGSAAEASGSNGRRGRFVLAAAVGLLMLLVGLELAGVSHLEATIIRLAVGQGTLVIEVDDPHVQVTVDGDNVRFRWDGHDLKLRPGDYTITASENGEPIQREIATILRNHRRLFRVTLNSPSNTEPLVSLPVSEPPTGTRRDTYEPTVWPDDAPPLAVVPFDAEQAAAHQTAWAKYLNLPVEYVNSIGMKFRLIPPGEFMMGLIDQQLHEFPILMAEHGEAHQENVREAWPAHRVRLTQPFYMSIDEVTCQQFEAATGRNPNADNPALSEYEFVREIFWNEAVHFCNLLSEHEQVGRCYHISGDAVARVSAAAGYRLPTEAEWEFACRAGTQEVYYFGMDVADATQLLKSGESALNEIFFRHGTLLHYRDMPAASNPFGLVRMYGSAAEWCWDWRDFTNYRTRARNSLTVDPQGPPNGPKHVERGGCSWNSSGMYVYHTSAIRHHRIGSLKGGFGHVVLDTEVVQNKQAHDEEQSG